MVASGSSTRWRAVCISMSCGRSSSGNVAASVCERVVRRIAKEKQTIWLHTSLRERSRQRARRSRKTSPAEKTGPYKPKTAAL